MRKFFSSALILLFVAFVFNAQAQNFTSAPMPKGQVPTTEAIYLYVTKGIEMSMKGGLDIKKGYAVSGVLGRETKSSDGTRAVEFYAVVETSSQKVCAWLMLYSSPDRSKKFLCIPTAMSPSTVWDKYFVDIRDSKISADAMLALNWGMAHLIGFLTNDDPNKKPSGLGGIGKK